MPPVDAGLPAFLDQTAEAGHGLPRSGIRLRRLRKVHRGATAPSPAGNLPSERYLTRNFLLPATLDNVYCNRFFGKCNRNFLLFFHASCSVSVGGRGPLCEPSAPKACAVLWRDFAATFLFIISIFYQLIRLLFGLYFCCFFRSPSKNWTASCTVVKVISLLCCKSQQFRSSVSSNSGIPLSFNALMVCSPRRIAAW